MFGVRGSNISRGSSVNSKGEFYPKIKCNYGKDAVVRTVKNGANVGMKFHGCLSWPDSHCDFFKWIPDNTKLIEGLQFQLLDKDIVIGEMEIELSVRDEKIKSTDERIKKLEMKKESLDEENQEMKIELREMRILLMNNSRKEKNYYSMSLFFFTDFFAIALFFVVVTLKYLVAIIFWILVISSSACNGKK